MNKKTARLIGEIMSLVGLTVATGVSVWFIFTIDKGNFVHIFFTIIMYLFIIATAIISIIYFFIKKKENIQIYYWILSIGLVALTTLHIILRTTSFEDGLLGYMSMALHLSLLLSATGAIIHYLGLENKSAQ